MKHREYHHPTEPVRCSECGQEYPPNTAICYTCNRYLINDWMGDMGTPDNQVRGPQMPLTPDPDDPVDVDYRTIDETPPRQTEWQYLWGRDPADRDFHARFLRWRKALVIMAAGYGTFLAFMGVQNYRTSLHNGVPQSAATSAQSVQSSSSGQTMTLHGTVNAYGQATAPVIIWQYADGKWVHEQGTALLDTGGGQQSILNGSALKANGGLYNPNLGTVQNQGIGTGSITGYMWPHVFVAPVTAPHAYFIANKTLPSGLGKAVDTQEVLNIGLGTLDQGQFHVNGTTWTWTYHIQSASQ